jgi:hypothetical protein
LIESQCFAQAVEGRVNGFYPAGIRVGDASVQGGIKFLASTLSVLFKSLPQHLMQVIAARRKIATPDFVLHKGVKIGFKSYGDLPFRAHCRLSIFCLNLSQQDVSAKGKSAPGMLVSVRSAIVRQPLQSPDIK